VFSQFFNGDYSLSLVQEYYPIYQLTLPIDSQTKTRVYQLDEFADMALQYLPPDYSSDTNKALYQTFVENWGTSYTVDSTDGGLVQMAISFQTKLVSQGGWTDIQVAQQAGIDFQNTLTGTSQALNKIWQDSRKLGTLACFGGNGAEYCASNILKSKWIPSIETVASSIKFKLADFTELISDMDRRSNTQQAISSYVREQQIKWQNMNTCPTCKWGTCQKPAQFCTCENPRIVGRLCDQCISTYTGDKCSTPVCPGGCLNGGKCVAPGQCQCVGKFQGPNCGQCTFGYSGSNCNTPICSGGCGNGRCNSPGQCVCNAKWALPSCTSCEPGWSGLTCTAGQYCFKCGGTGKICTDKMCNFKTTCNSCLGSGQINALEVRCFKCGGTGLTCSDKSCNFKNTCSGCNGMGRLKAGARRCPKCNGTGQVCTDKNCNFKSTCPQCGGKGYI